MVIAASQVERWVQPDLITLSTVGEAFVELASDAAAVAAVEGLAGLVFTSRSSAGARGVARAVVVVDADGVPAPLAVAGASVSVVAEGLTDTGQLCAGIALARIRSSAVLSIVGFGQAALAPIAYFPVSVEQVGVAEISFGDFGLDVPILPMTFPFAFSEASLLPRADARVVVDGVGVVSVGISGPAELAFRGSTDLSFEGSNPVFPFELPMVFDSDAVVRLAGAVADLGGQPFPLSVVFDEVAEVGIYAESEVLSSAFFPLRFPVYFVPSAATVAAARVVVGGDADVVVPVNAYADVSVLAFGVVPASLFPLLLPVTLSNGGTGFPWVLPVLV